MPQKSIPGHFFVELIFAEIFWRPDVNIFYETGADIEDNANTNSKFAAINPLLIQYSAVPGVLFSFNYLVYVLKKNG